MGSAVIKFEDVSFRYTTDTKFIIKNINLEIKKGEYIILAGPSGCGKTTLARLMVGLIPHFYSGEFTGCVYVDNVDTKNTSIREITKTVGYIFQNPEDQILMTEVLRDISFRLEYQGLSKNQIMEIVYDIAKKLRIDNLLHRNVNTLSGGELQKVAIAGVLVSKPKIIILDEPTAYLSPQSTVELINLVNELREKYDLTIIIIDHRLDLVMKDDARVIVLYDGSIMEDGDANEVLKKPLDKIYGLNIPTLTRLAHFIHKKYDVEMPTYLPKIDELLDVIVRVIK